MTYSSQALFLVTHFLIYCLFLCTKQRSNYNRKLALVGKFLIKFSSLSAPTKIEEPTSGSDETRCVVLIRLLVLLSLSELKEKRIG